MKIFAEKLVKTEVDRVCDVCGESVMVEFCGGKYAEFGELNASFGYGSKEDGNVYHLDLCEECFKTALYALKEHKELRLFCPSESISTSQKSFEVFRLS